MLLNTKFGLVTDLFAITSIAYAFN